MFVATGYTALAHGGDVSAPGDGDATPGDHAPVTHKGPPALGDAAAASDTDILAPCLACLVDGEPFFFLVFSVFFLGGSFWFVCFFFL